MSAHWFKTLIPADNARQFFDNYVQWYQSCKASYPTAYVQHKVIAAIQQPLQPSAICVRD